MAQLQLLPGKMNAFVDMSPEASLWDGKVRQTAPWTYEHKVVDLYGTLDWGRTITATIPRNCDRLAKLYIVLELYQLNSGAGGGRFVDYIGYRAFTSISLSLGNVTCDKLYPEVQVLKQEAYASEEEKLGELVGNSVNEQQLEDWAKSTKRYYVPIGFWFTERWVDALKMLEMYLSDVKITMVTDSEVNCIVSMSAGYAATSTSGGTTDGGIKNMWIHEEIVTFGDSEREQRAAFSSDPRNSMIDVIHQNSQLTTTTLTSGASSSKIQIPANHIVKDLLFFARKQSVGSTGTKQYGDWSGDQVAPFQAELFSSYKINANGTDRFDYVDPIYARHVQTRQFVNIRPRAFFYRHAQSLYPARADFTGGANWSRYDNPLLMLSYTTVLSTTYDLFVWFKNYNVINYQGGQVQVLFGG